MPTAGKLTYTTRIILTRLLSKRDVGALVVVADVTGALTKTWVMAAITRDRAGTPRTPL